MEQHSNVYVFRKITTSDELIDSFRLRYEVFNHPDYPRLINENIKGLEMNINSHDMVSRHFGVYLQTEYSEQMVGCIRIIGSEPIAFVQNVLQQLKIQDNTVPTSDPTTFPFQSFFPEVESILHLSLAKNKQSIFEHSRFCVLPPYRSIGLIRFLMQACIPISHADPNFQYSIITCKAQYRVLYQRNGYERKAQSNLADGLGNVELMVFSRAQNELRNAQLLEKLPQKDGCFYYHEPVRVQATVIGMKI